MSDTISSSSLASRSSKRSKSRSRERDQRIPTFQILVNDDEDEEVKVSALRRTIKRQENNHVSYSPPPSVLKGRQRPSEEDDDEEEENKNRKRGGKRAIIKHLEDEDEDIMHNHHQQQSLPLIFQAAFPKQGSSESVASGRGYRGPACSFAQELRVITSSVSSERTRRISPGSKFRTTSIDEKIDEMEPNDIIVLNANNTTTHNRSRSMVSCPMACSEVNNNDESYRRERMCRRERSVSLPANTGSRMPSSSAHQHLNATDDSCNDELFQNSEITTSASASTVDSQLTSVAQQLDEIRLAQNDLLKQLGDELSRVHSENEDLKKTIDGVRNQNDELRQVIQEANTEMERMKQIFRVRGLLASSSQPQTSECEGNEYNGDTFAYSRRERRSRSRSRSRDSSTGRRSSHSDTPLVHAGYNGSGESPTDLSPAVNKKKSSKKTPTEDGTNFNKQGRSMHSKLGNTIQDDSDPYNDNVSVAYQQSSISCQTKIQKERRSSTAEKKNQSRERKDKVCKEDNLPKGYGKNSSSKDKQLKEKQELEKKKAADGRGCCVRIFGCCAAKPETLKKDSSYDDIPFQNKLRHNSRD